MSEAPQILLEHRLKTLKLVFDSLSEGTGSQLQSNQSVTSSSIQYSSKV